MRGVHSPQIQQKNNNKNVADVLPVRLNGVEQFYSPNELESDVFCGVMLIA